MALKRITCPMCGSVLAMPSAKAGANIRCGKCNARFPLPRSDDTIAGWMDDTVDDLGADKYAPSKRPAAAQPPGAQGGTASRTHEQFVPPPPSSEGEIRLVRADKTGALFEFPADRLLEHSFRTAMPRLCVRCGIKNNIIPHLVIFGQEMMDCLTMEAERVKEAVIVLNDPAAMTLPNDELLKRFSKVPNVPQPADLPMPYWVCDMCTASKMVAAQAEINFETGAGSCRLMITKLRIAESFLAAAGGSGSKDHEELKKQIAAVRESPWEILQEVVQNRLQQWFKIKDDESFLAYVPDRTRMRAEDGMAGIVVTDQRMTLHTAARHKETPVAVAMEMELSVSGGKSNLKIQTGGMEIGMILDREGVSGLRRALIAGKYRVTWT
ncbi:MAG: hypothetical protein HZA50_02910 [Planctomycetes bacterium]|nr:hypothetical protein [Planctomycetota bacterium]